MSIYQYLQKKAAWIEPHQYRLWQTFTPVSYQKTEYYHEPSTSVNKAPQNRRYRHNRSASQSNGSAQFDAREQQVTTFQIIDKSDEIMISEYMKYEKLREAAQAGDEYSKALFLVTLPPRPLQMHKPAPQLLSRHTTTYRLRDNFTGYEYIHDQPAILRMKHFALLFASTLLHPFAVAGMMLVDSLAMSYCFACALVTALLDPISSLDYCRMGAKIGIAMLSKPIGWLGLVASNTIGLLFPNTGRKLYANLERDLYWTYVFAPCFQPASSAYMAGAFVCVKPIDRRTSDKNGDIEHLLGGPANKANAW